MSELRKKDWINETDFQAAGIAGFHSLSSANDGLSTCLVRVTSAAGEERARGERVASVRVSGQAVREPPLGQSPDAKGVPSGCVRSHRS
jgi:hypothetical protein